MNHKLFNGKKKEIVQTIFVKIVEFLFFKCFYKTKRNSIITVIAMTMTH